MGSVQRCFDEELVADSIIWHRLQLGVTFVLQDGWLCTTWTLLTLSLRSASRRDCKRQPFPPAAGQTEEKKKSDIQRLAAIWFFFLFFSQQIYWIKLSVRYWNTYIVETHLQRVLFLSILSLLRLSWDHAVYWDRWKMSPLSCNAGDMPVTDPRCFLPL